jgi:D-threo-aldose 1-dehydrogenase
MKKRQLGQTSLSVTELGFGGASIGNLYVPCTNNTALEVLSTSWDLGIRYFDTAPEYGNGLSERRMGDMLREINQDQYVLSTKVGDILYAIHDRTPPQNKFINTLPFHLTYDYSYDGVMRGFEDSLQRLGLNKIDILLVHDLDPVIHDQKQFQHHFKTYVEEGYKALSECRDKGIIKAIGLGVKHWEVCADAMKYGNYDCFMLQGNYTLLEQPALDSFMDICVKKNISILLAGPYASGILATGPVKGAYFHHHEASDDILKRVQIIQSICDSYHTPIQAAAIQFPLHHPAIASVVVGSASAEYMRDNVKYLQFKVPAALWKELKSAGIIPEHAPIG